MQKITLIAREGQKTSAEKKRSLVKMMKIPEIVKNKIRNIKTSIKDQKDKSYEIKYCCEKCKNKFERSISIKKPQKPNKKRPETTYKKFQHRRANSLAPSNMPNFNNSNQNSNIFQPQTKVNVWINNRASTCRPEADNTGSSYCVLENNNYQIETHKNASFISPPFYEKKSKSMQKIPIKINKLCNTPNPEKSKLLQKRELYNKNSLRFIDWASSPLFWNIKNGVLEFNPDKLPEIFTINEIFLTNIIKDKSGTILQNMYKKAKNTLKMLATELKLSYKYKQIKENNKIITISATQNLLSECKKFFEIRKILIPLLMLVNERDVYWLLIIF